MLRSIRLVLTFIGVLIVVDGLVSFFYEGWIEDEFLRTAVSINIICLGCFVIYCGRALRVDRGCHT